MSDAGDPQAFEAAVRELLNADSWEGVCVVLDRYPVLMSDEVLTSIIKASNAAEEDGQHETRVWLLVHSYLLGKCQELGVEKGFAAWTEALRDQVLISNQRSRDYFNGDGSALDDALEQTLWALMGTRRPGPLYQLWDPVLDQLRFLIQEWITKRNGGNVALGLLLRLLRENAQRVGKDDPSWPARTMLCSQAAANWFQLNGGELSLDTAIDLAQQAVAAHPDPKWISDLGRLHLFRFEVKRRAEDLQAAIHSQREVLQMIGSEHAGLRASALDRLGMALRTSFEQFGVVDELNEAIVNHDEAVRVSASNGSTEPAYLGNLAGALMMRNTLTNDDEDHRRAGQLLRQEVELCKPGHPLRADALGNLGGWLTLDKETPGASAEAIGVLKEAIQLAVGRHVKWTWELSLAQVLIAAPGEESRNEAQQHLQAVLNETPPEWPNRSLALALLGRLQANAGSDEAGETLAQAVTIGLSNRPDAARSAADDWLSWAISKHRTDELKKASARSLDVLDVLSRRQDDVSEQVQWRIRSRRAVEDAAFALADAGEIDLAVAHLERGRATVLRQSLDFPAEPHGAAATLAALPPDMRVVYLIAARAGGIALIPREDVVTAHSLPEFTVERVYDAVLKLLNAQENRTRLGGAAVWRGHLDSVTRWMYEAVVEQLLDPLSQLGPNVALLTDGLVGLLPWPSAWEPDATAPHGRRYFIDLPIDLTIAPTAALLANAAIHARSVNSERVLIVAPSDSSANVLKDIDAEVAAVAAAHPGAIELRTGVTPTAVLNAAQEAAIVHFACHGRVNLLEPLESYLLLSGDSHLTAADLLSEKPRPGRLVILSACETSAAGVVAPTEVLGLPLSFLRRGFAGVVGSLWPIRDDGAALLMGKFHQLVANSSPAMALAEAQRWLRELSRDEVAELLGHPVDGEFSQVETWGAFTFTGV